MLYLGAEGENWDPIATGNLGVTGNAYRIVVQRPRATSFYDVEGAY